MDRKVGTTLGAKRRSVRTLWLAALAACLGLALLPKGWASEEPEPIDRHYSPTPPAPSFQTWDMAEPKSGGCVSCHTDSDQKTMHASSAVVLGCADCHGGDPNVRWTGAPVPTRKAAPRVEHPEIAHGLGTGEEEEYQSPYPPEYQAAIDKAHILPSFPQVFRNSANPERSYSFLARESREFVRFVNPSDYRVAREACGACHMPIISAAERSLMANAAMFWGAAAYNNGILPYKFSILGEVYDKNSVAGILKLPVEIDANMHNHDVLGSIAPMPSWETTPPGDVFRVFERGGRNIGNLFSEIGIPSETGAQQRLEEPGRPDLRQSNRGPGTGLRVSIPVLNVHKTRLNDPFTWYMGTNDNPGDFRHSGCSSCHVIYANDRDPRHSAVWAKYGNFGMSAQIDPTIPK